MRILVTGANGFIGLNVVARLKEKVGYEVHTFVSGESTGALAEKVAAVDFIIHLAGVNRPQTEDQFITGNTDLTLALCDAVCDAGRPVPVIYASSIQAELDSPYGVSKRLAEEALEALGRATRSTVLIYRLPNVFGKWARPNYNSAVATFCHNIANDLPIQINNPDALIKLVYIDDVVGEFIRVIEDSAPGSGRAQVTPVYQITVGALAEQLYAFKASRVNGITEAVGTGLTRALYSTYLSYLSPQQFSYPLVKHEDPRGVFVEMLKTKDSGQFSFFTAHPGITRGGHYHHSKNEKFLVIKGQARFGFRHIVRGDVHEHFTSADVPEVVETIPGWSHDITNVGSDEMVVMLWANEIFDRQHPDTVSFKV